MGFSDQQRLVHRFRFFGQRDLLLVQMPIHPQAVVNEKKRNDKPEENRIDEDQQLPANRQLMPSVFECVHHGTSNREAGRIFRLARLTGIERNQKRLAEFSRVAFRGTCRSFAAARSADAAAVRSLSTTGRLACGTDDIAGRGFRFSVLSAASCVHRAAIRTLGTAGGLRSCARHFVRGRFAFSMFATACRVNRAAVRMFGTTRRFSRGGGVNVARDERNGKQNSREYGR
jgi:hypothetical protein